MLMDSPHASLFPFLFGGAFIEARPSALADLPNRISLPFRRGFH